MAEFAVTRSGGRLEAKVAIVTGTGSGIGQATARLFARHGARVVGGDIDSKSATATVAAMADEGLEMDSLQPVDLRVPGEVQRLVDFAVDLHGGFDVLVTPAARFIGAPIAEMDFEVHWRGTLASELDGVFLICKAAWPHLIARGGGSIINIASTNAHQAIEGLPSLVHSAGKAGVLGMTRELAKEGAPHGIRANTLSPGMVVTNATRRFLDRDREFASRITEQHMLKRLGTPEDVAWGALYLASDESRWVTASDIRIDGGWTGW